MLKCIIILRQALAEITHREKIPTCTINKNTITKILNLIEGEIQKIKSEDPEIAINLDLTIQSNKKTITIHNSKEFPFDDIPRDLKNIGFDLRVYDDNKKIIDIDIGIGTWADPQYRIVGNDSTWVNGVVGSVEEIFKQTSNRHQVFHTPLSNVPISIGFAIAFGFALSLTLVSQNLVDTTKPDSFFNIMFTSSICSFWLFLYFLPWIFPRIEVEGYGTARKFRKAIFWVIITIISGLFIAGLAKKFFG